MPIYRTRAEVLAALAAAPKGAPRAAILSVPENRGLVFKIGASVLLYSGRIQTTADTVTEKLSNAYTGILLRKNVRRNEPDGWGSMGGLSELIDEDAYEKLSPSEQLKLVGYQDNVILNDRGRAVLTDDFNIIRQNNVIRETREELADIGIENYPIDFTKMELTVPQGIRDDNFLINIWPGKGPGFAATSYNFILHVPEKTIDDLHAKATQYTAHHPASEAMGYVKMPLIETLSHWGKKGGKYQSEDGRDLSFDFRYPHQLLSHWYIASKLLNHNEKDMLQLAAFVQTKSSHLVDFAEVALRMDVDLDFMAGVLKISPQTMHKMRENMCALFKQKESALKKDRSL
ncbi:MAG: hypothetical protein LBU87_06275 [Lactobacillales bacterium]|jgi:hypothetical protein|nr:hypothetical protein [Lactobacillales bacterium]